MAFNAFTTKRYWNAATNDLALVAGRAENGDAYLVSVGGTTDIGQSGDWRVGDIAYFAIDRWVRIPGDISEFFSTVYAVDTVADLKALKRRPLVVYVRGYWSPGDGGGGHVWWDNLSAATANDGSVFECAAGPAGRYKRSRDGSDTWNVLKYGAKGDGVADDRPRFSAAVADCSAGGGGTVYVPTPPVAYRFLSTLVINAGQVNIRGENMSATLIRGDFATGDVISFGDGTSAPNFCTISDLRIDGGSATRTAGASVRFRNGHNLKAERMQFGLNHYTCIQLDGGPLQFIYEVDQCELNHGSYGIRVGFAGGIVQDCRISRCTVDAQAEVGMEIVHASGIYGHDNSILTCNRGFAVVPGENQYVTAGLWGKSLSDTCASMAWHFAPTHVTASISDFYLMQCYGTSSGVADDAAGFDIDPGLGVITSIGFVGCEAANNLGAGFIHRGGTEVAFTACNAMCNSRAGSGLYHGLSIQPGVSNWQVNGGTYGAGGRIDVVDANGQGYGIVINGGASDHFSIIGANVLGNVIAGISNGATGMDREIHGNIGYRTENSKVEAGGTHTTDGGGDIVITHGLSEVPAKVFASLMSGTAAYHLQAHTLGPTTFRLVVIDMNGSGVPSTLIADPIAWQAIV